MQSEMQSQWSSFNLCFMLAYLFNYMFTQEAQFQDHHYLSGPHVPHW